MKKCNRCKKTENEVEFSNSKKYYCKLCVKYYNQQYSIKQGCKLKFQPIVTDTHKQCCKCKELKLLSDYSNSPRGRKGKSSYCKPCASKYQLNKIDKETRRLNTQKYRDNNREWWRSLHRINQFNRKKKVKALQDGTVTSQVIKDILQLETCYYCKEFTPEKFRTIEHKHPLNKGGQHSINNLTMACSLCNVTKRDMTEQEFLTYKNNFKNEN
jgi:hypothetical protein